MLEKEISTYDEPGDYATSCNYPEKIKKELVL